MVYFIEGARNSGKSYLSKAVSGSLGIPRFQYEFAHWFGYLALPDNTRESHSFAMGKETMLLQLIRDDMVKPKFLIDRGIFSALAWGVMEGRISQLEGDSQLLEILDKKLLSKCTFIYVYGENPEGIRKGKDHWDKKDAEKEREEMLIEHYLDFAVGTGFKVNVIYLKNDFDPSSIEKIKGLIK